MNKINILDSKVFNRIAAGEVVERPASVVKELVENSLDAGATRVSIEIFSGGTKSIEITDNGYGIDSDNIQKAFMPHATSKIKNVSDLEKISTLGFRGEALSSIANVSQVRMESKTKNSNAGGFINIEGGDIKSKGETAFAEGTKVTVSNLFYNVPARLKFLKKNKTEENEISNLILRLILANPNVAFNYIADSKTIFKSSGKGLEDAIYSVYGKSTLDNLMKIKKIDSASDIKISGFIGKPNFTKSNRTYQTLIINGRYVQNNMVSAAVYSAYQDYLMKRQFPFFIININIPFDQIDINVHPSKLEIKFENSQRIYGLIYNIVKSKLLDNTASLASNVGDDGNDPSTNDDFNIKNVSLEKYSQKEGKSYSKDLQKSIFDSNAVETNESVFQDDSSDIGSKDDSNDNLYSYKYGLDLNYVGNIFNTYILVQANDDIYIIDQHAAHERILYDKLISNFKRNKPTKQLLLVPHVISLNNLEYNFIYDYTSTLLDLGFEIEEFGDLTLKIAAVPSTLTGINLDMFFNEILNEMNELKKLEKVDLVKEKLAQVSCKAAVRAGDSLADKEVESLVQKMKSDNTTLLCPHGRPIVVKITKNQLEKWFKRVV